LNKIPTKTAIEWPSFSNEELKEAIVKYNNSLTLGLDKMSWKHLKVIVKDDRCLNKIINIANTCINLGHWPLHFKVSSFIITPKPNKASYNSPNMFQPISLLNMLGKLIEKVIGEILQFQFISNNFIHPNQLGGLKQQSTTNAGIFQTHLIHSEWVKDLQTSTLVFDIAQFFLFLNHHHLSMILDKVDFDFRISSLTLELDKNQLYLQFY